MIDIMRYEIEKIIKSMTFISSIIVSFLILAGIFFIGFNYSQLSLSEPHNQEKGFSQLSKKSADAHAGEFNDQTVQEILSDFMVMYQSKTVEQRPFDLFSWNIADVFFAKDKDIYIEMNDGIEQGEKMTIDQVKVLSMDEVGFSKFSTPLTIGSYTNWSDLFKVSGSVFILISVLVIVICSTVFSGEVARNISQLLLSTKYGRTKMLTAKIYVSTLISIILFVLVHMLTFFYFYFHYYGMDGWNASIQTNFSLKLFNFPLEVNNLQIYLLILIFQLAGLLALVGVTLFISAVTKTTFSSLAISIGLFFLPLGLISLFKTGFINTLLYLFPINLYNPEKMLTVMSSSKGFIFHNFSQNFAVTLCFLLSVKIIADLFSYFKLHRSQAG
ncbi:conserved membrane hypothetical protein [Carnobacterium maltaromaticum]|uniref:ABC transporter permease subunit n=1 Tax=Carnobacterium maltaromaticum TaxID=2751 RepID=UPI00191BACCC|nr:ABC transporter permease subunit [Carnobacterium maltaromaticum]CAD5902068.1 conserved membrane hypothetical protein [Carnobacterium maltaromaticum]